MNDNRNTGMPEEEGFQIDEMHVRRPHDRKSRTLLYVVVAVAVIALGIGGWMIYEATSRSNEMKAMQEQIEQQQLDMEQMQLQQDYDDLNREFAQFENSRQIIQDDSVKRQLAEKYEAASLQVQQLLNELNDSHTAVVLFDLVLGYGASATPASELLDQLSHIDMNNAPLLIAHVCGTEADPQIRSQQISALQNAGIIIASSNAQAALWASAVAQTQLQKKGLNA